MRRFGAKEPLAYLDVEGLLAVARQTGCDAVPPGYGVLAGNVELARRGDGSAFVFCGTWLLVGCERAEPDLSLLARKAGLTIGQGVGGGIRLFSSP